MKEDFFTGEEWQIEEEDEVLWLTRYWDAFERICIKHYAQSNVVVRETRRRQDLSSLLGFDRMLNAKKKKAHDTLSLTSDTELMTYRGMGTCFLVVVSGSSFW